MNNNETALNGGGRTGEKTIIILAILILLALSFATMLTQPQRLYGKEAVSSHASQSPDSVANSFDVVLNDGNSSAALVLFADGATVSDLSNIACLPGPPPFCQGQNVFNTKTQIAGWLEQLVSDHIELNRTEPFRVSYSNVSWTVEVALDEYRRLGVAPLDARINAIVENGKFTSFSIELTAESTERLSEAYANRRATPYSAMAEGLAFGLIVLGLVFPAAALYYVSKVKRLFATVPHLNKPWVLLGAGVVALFVSVLFLLLSDVASISVEIVDSLFGVTLTACAFLVMSSMILMKRVMLDESDE